MEYSFLRIADKYVNICRNLPLPVVICDRNFEVCWSNRPMKEAYPDAVNATGISDLLSEYDPDDIILRAEREGNCTIPGVLSLTNVSLSITPILKDDRAEGFLMLFVSSDMPPAPHTPYLVSRTAEAFSGGIRETVGDIFATMDTAALKASFLDAGWIKESFDQISADSYRILRTANNIAQYARFQSGFLDAEPHAFDVGGSLTSCRDIVQALGNRAGIPVEFRIPGESCIAKADRALFELILFNLLHNSLYFTRPGNRVRISAANRDRQVLLTVSDRGIGVPGELVDRVWQPYYSYSPKEGRGAGMGLGLTLARLAAKALGGKITLRSRQGYGTTVTVRFPAAGPSLRIQLGRDDSDISHNDRFSPLYTSLSDVLLSPYRF